MCSKFKKNVSPTYEKKGMCSFTELIFDKPFYQSTNDLYLKIMKSPCTVVRCQATQLDTHKT